MKKSKMNYRTDKNDLRFKKNASYLKALLVDFWLAKHKIDLIVNEAPFLKGNRRADLIMIEGNKLIAFEIKSELDSLKSLESQLEDYIKVFDQVYLVISDKFSNSRELKKISHKIGIILWGTYFKIKKEARIIKKFKKTDLLSILWRKDLETLLKKRHLEFDSLIKKVLSCSTIFDIKKQIIDSLMRRYGGTYQCFLQDREDYTSIEDLDTITGINKPVHFG